MTDTSVLPNGRENADLSNSEVVPLNYGSRNMPSYASSNSSVRLEHLGDSRQYWRDMILGVNDGIISTFLLVTGVAGGGLSSTEILLTAIAGSVAGAVSMAAGEYVATKSQNEVIHSELALEKIHIQKNMEEELLELEELMDLIGITPGDELRQHMHNFYEKNPDSLLQLMKVLEFGILDSELRAPWRAGLTSCTLFACGSIPSVIPFIFSGDRPNLGLLAATVMTVITLMLVGGIKTWATRADWLASAIENLAIAGVGGVLAYAIGVFFNYVMDD